ncbi:MAG: DUF1569 domain-containing protein [Leptospiraceae bacterium]|nr:DUF1569 domain-containing protein [Leptospiraceae bacterium]
MQRKTFVKIALGSTALVASGGGFMFLSGSKNIAELTIDHVLKKIDELSQKNISSKGAWSPFKIFSHCAQSIEYSISGYPQHKSAFFKSTVGPLAFAVFSARGSMKHGLQEDIPGATALPAKGDTQEALAHLKQTYLNFQKYNGPLAAHFAYGDLTKEEYMLAHILHFNNHLLEIEAV